EREILPRGHVEAEYHVGDQRRPFVLEEESDVGQGQEGASFPPGRARSGRAVRSAAGIVSRRRSFPRAELRFRRGTRAGRGSRRGWRWRPGGGGWRGRPAPPGGPCARGSCGWWC